MLHAESDSLTLQRPRFAHALVFGAGTDESLKDHRSVLSSKTGNSHNPLATYPISTWQTRTESWASPHLSWIWCIISVRGKTSQTWATNFELCSSGLAYQWPRYMGDTYIQTRHVWSCYKQCARDETMVINLNQLSAEENGLACHGHLVISSHHPTICNGLHSRRVKTRT